MRTRIAVLGVVLGLAAAAGGALLTWWTVLGQHRVLGPQQADLTGAQVIPVLPATLAAAGLALLLVALTRGAVRRALLVAIAVLAAAALTIVLIGQDPVGGAATLRSAVADSHPQWGAEVIIRSQPAGRILAGIGAALALTASVLLVIRPPRARPKGEQRTAADDDDSRLWRDLDDGSDPTR